MSDHCASCGKAHANLNACNACQMVKYCGRNCQLAHRPAHKKACEIAARELFDLQLFSEPSRREDCPICMIPLPCNYAESSYMSCCGKSICNGCRYCLTRENCPFCNTPNPTNEEELIKRLSERMEKFNDRGAINLLGNYYRDGVYGLPVDKSKAIELLQSACELGSASGHYNLGCSYEMGVGIKIDKKKAVHHYQIAAIMGNVCARHNLGGAELKNGNYQRAMKHFMMAAKCGFKVSLQTVKEGFTQGHVTKQDFEKTLRDYQASCDETKSDQRDRAAVIKAARVRE